MRYVHTCYRVLDLDRSIDFYANKLGLELARKTPIGDDATNAFFAVPGDPSPDCSPSTTTRRNLTSSGQDTATSPSPSKTSTPWRTGSKKQAAWTSRAATRHGQRDQDLLRQGSRRLPDRIHRAPLTYPYGH